ncbi:hypothetical protein H5410_002925, partial [Solanum commersonii]
MESFFVRGHLNNLVELELAFEASMVSLRFFDNGKTWTLLIKKEQRQLKEQRNEVLRIVQHVWRVAKRSYPCLLFQIEQDGDKTYQRAVRRVNRRSQLTTPNDPLLYRFFKTINTLMVELNEIVVANTISPLCFRLARERGRKTKTTKLMFKRVNPSPSPTHSARESGLAKVEVVLHAITRCSRETELIQ